MGRNNIGALGLGCMLALTAACETAQGATSPATQQAPAIPTELREYAPARWRLARERLHEVLLKVSHIAIRHRGSDEDVHWLRAPGWRPDKPLERTREEAIELAFELANQLQEKPELFAELAKKHSDDEVTAPWGGSLGLTPAGKLSDSFLDAIATLIPGHSSLPFETEYGIHIVRLDEAPPAQQLAASRILIGYNPSSLALERPGHKVTRSRKEAYALAAEVMQKARVPGADFEALVERYSDAVDAEQQGDLGVWSTYESSRWPLAMEAVSTVPVSGVTEPVDTAEGLQILKRMPLTARDRFSMDYVLVSELGRTEVEVQSELSAVIAAVGEDAAQFDLFRSELCCKKSWTWTAGRGPGPAVERVLKDTAVGDIVLSPIETSSGLYLVRKREPPPEQAPSPLLRLPAPEVADLDGILKNTDGAALAQPLQAAARQLEMLPFDGSKRERLQELVATVVQTLPAAPPEKRPDVLNDFWRSTSEFLSPQEAQHVRHSITAFTTSFLMSN